MLIIAPEFIVDFYIFHIIKLFFPAISFLLIVQEKETYGCFCSLFDLWSRMLYINCIYELFESPAFSKFSWYILAVILCAVKCHIIFRYLYKYQMVFAHFNFINHVPYSSVNISLGLDFILAWAIHTWKWFDKSSQLICSILMSYAPTTVY